MEDIVRFIDENVLRKSSSVEEFNEGIKTVINYLKLKGPIDGPVKKYLEALVDCSTEIIAIKNKNVSMSTSSFFPSKEEIIYRDANIEPSHSYHYGASC